MAYYCPIKGNTRAQEKLLLYSEHIYELAKDFCNHYGFSYLQVRRTFDDGSFFMISTKGDFFRDCLEIFKQSPSQSYRTRNNLHTPDSGVYLWDEALPPILTSLASKKHGMFHGIALYQYTESYCDVLSFALPQKTNFASSYYLNWIKNMESYRDEFLKKNDFFLKKMGSECLIKLPKIEEKSLPIHFLKTRGKEIYNVEIGLRSVELSLEEFIMIKFLESGHSIQKISELINVSGVLLRASLSRLEDKIGCSLYQFNSLKGL